MTNHIGYYDDIKSYNDDNTKDYPNVSLVEGEGLIWKSEADVLWNNGKIKWNTELDGRISSTDNPNISFSAAKELIDAVYNGTPIAASITYHYDDGKLESYDFVDADVYFETQKGTNLLVYIVDQEENGEKAPSTPNLWGKVAELYYNQSRSAVPQGDYAEIVTIEGDYPLATWEITYTIKDF